MNFAERVAAARNDGQVISRLNMAYEERLANINGMAFTLLVEEHHSPSDIISARSHLRNSRDVVSISIVHRPCS